MIGYGKQSIGSDDIDAVAEVLSSEFLTQGPKVGEFEETLAEYVGVKYAVASNSGTSALHLACLALGIGKGDRVWTSPLSFVASANCARMVGADVDFVDIDFSTRNMCMEKLALKLEMAKSKGNLPKAVVVVHFAGLSADMQKLKSLSIRYDFFVIEDACHALGASYQGSMVGSCEYSDCAIFSFHPVKSITSAEGGMLVTNNQSIAKKVRQFASHAIERKATPEEPWLYQQTDLGFNYRLSDIHAALGVNQLGKLKGFIKQRQRIASRYIEELNRDKVYFATSEQIEGHAFHLFVINFSSTEQRLDTYHKLVAQGIQPQVHYIPIHYQPYYRDLGFTPGDYPEVERYYQTTLSLPIFTELTEDVQSRVISIINA